MFNAVWRLVFVGSLAVTLTAIGKAESLENDRELRVGYHLELSRFGGGFTEKDVAVATQMLIGKIIEKQSHLKPEFKVFKEEEKFLRAVAADELDYIEISPLLWLRLPESLRSKIDLLSIVQQASTRLEHFVLLAEPGATLASLAGKKLRVRTVSDRGIAHLWLSHELKTVGLPSLESHFGDAKIVAHGEDALLSTFFGKADACLVREEDYRVAVELNPQIGKRLVPVRRSPGFPFIVTAATGSKREAIKARLSDQAVKDITGKADAAQAFSLLRLRGLVPFEQSDILPLKTLVEAMDKPTRITANEEGELGE